MTKPIGPICNLDCTYCFYLEKEKLFTKTEQFRMSDEALESYIRQYIALQDGPEITFAWQGGEPTLLGVEFFEKAVALQARYGKGRTISNAIQTNGTLLDDRWCEFLSRHKFLVGISIDGPADLHNAYRVDKRGRDTFDDVMRGVGFLKKHQTEFNTLTVVNRQNSRHPLRVYNFLKQIGSGFIQFIPLVERKPGQEASSRGFDLALPPVLDQAVEDDMVTSWSVRPKDYGAFLVTIFDDWVRKDVGQVFVQLFDVALGNWVGAPGGLCVFSERCGKALALEHNGDLYACDHYVYPEFKLGNILNQSMGEMAASEKIRKFGNDKADKLPAYCRTCDVRFACHGECPKHRFLRTPDGEPGLNYLCEGYQQFFRHVDPYMKAMGNLLRSRRPPAEIMTLLAQREKRAAPGPAGRNDPCPCGSGKKVKKCCGRGGDSAAG